MLDSRDAIETLITDHLPLVGHVARETAARLPRHLGTDDLVGAGSLALVQAAQSFDPELGVPFARFANTRVRGAMIDSMRQRDWASRTVRTRSKAIDSAAETLTAGLGRRPNDAELAAACGLTESEVRDARHGADRAVLLGLSGPRPDRIDAAAAEIMVTAIRETGRLRRGGRPELAFEAARGTHRLPRL